MRKAERLERTIAAIQEYDIAECEFNRNPDHPFWQLRKSGAWNARNAALSRLTNKDITEIRGYAREISKRITENARITMEVFYKETSHAT